MSVTFQNEFFDFVNNNAFPLTKYDIGEEMFQKLESMFKEFDSSNETDTKKLFCYGIYLHLCNVEDCKVPFLDGSNLGCDHCSNYLGLIFKSEDNYTLAKYFYKKAIEKGNKNAMHNFGCYYQTIEKDYEKMKYYYGLAIEKGNKNAMHNLADYYQTIEKDYEKMKYYYGLAIEKGSVISLNNLGVYYEEVKKDFGMAKYYYGLAIEKGNVESMKNLADYYSTDKGGEKNLKMMIYYLEMAVEKGCEISMDNLCKYYASEDCKYEIEALQFFYKHDKMDNWIRNLKYDLENCGDEKFNLLLNYLVDLDKANDDKYSQIKSEIPYLVRKLIDITSKKFDILDLHFKYAPTAEGFEEAKKDFLSLEQK